MMPLHTPSTVQYTTNQKHVQHGQMAHHSYTMGARKSANPSPNSRWGKYATLLRNILIGPWRTVKQLHYPFSNFLREPSPLMHLPQQLWLLLSLRCQQLYMQCCLAVSLCTTHRNLHGIGGLFFVFLHSLFILSNLMATDAVRLDSPFNCRTGRACRTAVSRMSPLRRALGGPALPAYYLDAVRKAAGFTCEYDSGHFVNIIDRRIEKHTTFTSFFNNDPQCEDPGAGKLVVYFLHSINYIGQQTFVCLYTEYDFNAPRVSFGLPNGINCIDPNGLQLYLYDMSNATRGQGSTLALLNFYDAEGNSKFVTTPDYIYRNRPMYEDTHPKWTPKGARGPYLCTNPCKQGTDQFCAIASDKLRFPGILGDVDSVSGLLSSTHLYQFFSGRGEYPDPPQIYKVLEIHNCTHAAAVNDMSDPASPTKFVPLDPSIGVFDLSISVCGDNFYDIAAPSQLPGWFEDVVVEVYGLLRSLFLWLKGHAVTLLVFVIEELVLSEAFFRAVFCVACARVTLPRDTLLYLFLFLFIVFVF